LLAAKLDSRTVQGFTLLPRMTAIEEGYSPKYWHVDDKENNVVLALWLNSVYLYALFANDVFKASFAL
jgi:hypothetical protein